MLSGFQRKEGEKQGFELIQVKAWDYPALQDAYTKAEHFARTERVPVIIHVIEVTQPQGHSTSGSHERYKSAERLQWEQEHDGLKKFREWILNYEIEGEDGTMILASEEELDLIDKEAKKEAKDAQKKAWDVYQGTIVLLKDKALPAVEKLATVSANAAGVNEEIEKFKSLITIAKKEVFHLLRRSLWVTRGENSAERQAVKIY